MTEKVFIDSDIILDLVLKRDPFFVDSQRLFSLIERNYFSGFTSSLILANCYYIIANNKDKKTALKTISKLRSILKVLPFTNKEIGESLNSNITDFEDGVQYFIALNISDYKGLDINVLTPKDFLNLEKIKKIIEGKSVTEEFSET
jgi:predicted nucleic acid-binding protein